MELQYIRSKIPEEIARSVVFENHPDYVIIRAKKPLNPKDFSKLVGIIRDLGGRWISAGPKSHFLIEDMKKKIA